MITQEHQNKILEEAKRVRGIFPKGKNKGKCFDAASLLQESLESFSNDEFYVSIQFGWFNEETHCWIEVWNNCPPVILDVTVDQFGDELPEILFDSPSNWPQYTYDVGEIRCRRIMTGLN